MLECTQLSQRRRTWTDAILRIATILAVLSSVGCGDREAFWVTHINAMPDKAQKIRANVNIGNLSGIEEWNGQPTQISIWLPRGIVYWDESSQRLIGVLLRMRVEAMDGACVLATGEAEQEAEYKVRHEMTIDLVSTSTCDPQVQ